MKSLMTTLIIALAFIGGMSQQAHALGASGKPLIVKTFPIFGTTEYEAECQFAGFDPNIEACAMAKQACQFSLRECVTNNCNHKNNPRRYECTYEQWHGDSNSFSGGCGDVIQNQTNASLRDLCLEAVAAQQGEGTGSSSDNVTPPPGYVDVNQPTSDQDDTQTDPTPPSNAGVAVDPHPLEILAEVINNSPDPDAARAYFQFLHQLILLQEAIDALPTEGQRQAAREYFEFLHQLSLLQEAIDALPDEKQRQAARDYLTALNAGNTAGFQGQGGVKVEDLNPFEDNQINLDTKQANQGGGAGCQLAGSGASSQAWYLIVGLLPLMVMNLRRK